MKTRLIPLVLAVILSVPHSNGQDNKVRSGIGISIISYGASIYFPIIAGRNFRIEPELGILGLPDRLLPPIQQESPGLDKLGIGLFYAIPLRGSNNLYFGPRVARFASSMGSLFWSDVGSEPVRLGYLIGPSAGVELGSLHFTVGFELGLDYVKVWSFNEKIYPPGTAPTTSQDAITRSGFLGEGRLSVHFYF